jgi:hypothetical protein
MTLYFKIFVGFIIFLLGFFSNKVLSGAVNFFTSKGSVVENSQIQSPSSLFNTLSTLTALERGVGDANFFLNKDNCNLKINISIKKDQGFKFSGLNSNFCREKMFNIASLIFVSINDRYEFLRLASGFNEEKEAYSFNLKSASVKIEKKGNSIVSLINFNQN